MTLGELLQMYGNGGRQDPQRALLNWARGPSNVVGQKFAGGELFAKAHGIRPKSNVVGQTRNDVVEWARGLNTPQPSAPAYQPPQYRPFRADPLPQHFSNDWSGMNNAVRQRHPTLAGLLNYQPQQQQRTAQQGPSPDDMGRMMGTLLGGFGGGR